MVWRGLSARRATRRSWFLEALEGKTLLATFVVTSTNAGGAGSLLVAIQNANSTPGLDTIAFGIGSGVQTIRPSAALPTITEPVVIDGTTQPGYGGAPLIELDGSLAGAGASGLTITGGGTTVRGLVINRFGGNGIQITNAGGNALAGNYLGTDVAGTLDRGNGLDGVSIDNSANNIVGGVAPAERNVISGNNAHGVRIYGGSANNNVIQGNTIGLNAAGTAAIGNTINGIVIDNGADNNLVGGTSPGARNVVSGNLEAGVEIQDGSSTGNRIEGNIIGLNAAGTAAIGNLDGVVIKDSPNNTVGGTTTAHRNIISGNTGGSQGNGVVVFGTNATGNLVQNNFIGTDLTGRLDLGNARSGVLISDNGDGGSFKGAAAANTVRDNVLSGNNYAGVGIANFGVNSNLILGNFIGVDASGTGALGNSVFGVVIWNGANGNRIGGITPGAGNVIAYNDRGVIVDANSRSSVNNSIRGNSIHDNAVLGIDLNNDGVSQNDLGDFDRGPNNTRNYPVITSGVVIGTNLTLAGTLNTIRKTRSIAITRY